MTVYSDYTFYGPYTRKDGRQHCVLVKHNENGSIIETVTVSYPKYLVEVYLNRYLLENETVDHIDGNFLNNDLRNLRVVDRSEHCRSHAMIRKSVNKTCIICGKSFVTNNNSRVTCGSKQCAGKCAHLSGHDKDMLSVKKKNEYISLRSLVEEIQSVEGANSVNSSVDNAEQEKLDFSCVETVHTQPNQ